MLRKRSTIVKDLVDAVRPRLNQFPFALTVADPEQHDCPVVYANSHFSDLTGYNQQEVIGKNCRFLQNERPTIETLHIRAAIQNHADINCEITNYTKQGRVFRNLLCVRAIALGETHLFVASQGLPEVRQNAGDELICLPGRTGLAEAPQTFAYDRRRLLDTWANFLRVEFRRLLAGPN